MKDRGMRKYISKIKENEKSEIFNPLIEAEKKYFSEREKARTQEEVKKIAVNTILNIPYEISEKLVRKPWLFQAYQERRIKEGLIPPKSGGGKENILKGVYNGEFDICIGLSYDFGNLPNDKKTEALSAFLPVHKGKIDSIEGSVCPDKERFYKVYEDEEGDRRETSDYISVSPLFLKNEKVYQDAKKRNRKFINSMDALRIGTSKLGKIEKLSGKKQEEADEAIKYGSDFYGEWGNTIPNVGHLFNTDEMAINELKDIGDRLKRVEGDKLIIQYIPWRRHKEGGQSELESKLPVIIGISGLIGAIFFLSSNLTGNVIGNMTNFSSNMIGGILFLVGLIGSYFYIRKK